MNEYRKVVRRGGTDYRLKNTLYLVCICEPVRDHKHDTPSCVRFGKPKNRRLKPVRQTGHHESYDFGLEITETVNLHSDLVQKIPPPQGIRR